MTQKQELNEKKKPRENESGYSPIPSYPCSDTGIHSKSRRKSDSESGRSMVEMLGVLAIMGVLAIGGITGYRYAMDKYNANEILNEVRKRAVTASQQRILGRTIDLSEWNNTIQGHPVTAADNYGGDTSFFALTVSGIEQGVCDLVIKEKIPFAVEEKVGEVVVGEDTTCAEGDNAVTFAFKNTLDGEGATGGGEEPDPCENVTCPAGTSCSKGMCICSETGQEVCGQTCCPENQMCSSDVGGCVDVTGCQSNADCGDDEYCKISVSYAFSETSCYKDYTGTCTAIGSKSEATIEGLGTVTVYGSIFGMTWWSAKNWCAAQGKRLISTDHLGCYQNDGKTPFGDKTTGFCCAQGQASCRSTASKQSAIMQALRSKWGGRSVWTNTGYDSCNVFYVTLYNGYVGKDHHHYGKTALCEE